MSGLLAELLERPSRTAAGVVVVLVHVAFVWLLASSLGHSLVAPVLKAVQVNLMSDPPPHQMPEPPPQSQQLPVAPQLYVPLPEVNVSRDTAVTIVAASITPPIQQLRADPAPPSDLHDATLLVVPESAVDYVKIPEIKFPLAAKRAKEQGTVMLSVVVDDRGLVSRISVFRSSGYQRLDEAAIRSVRTARFRPYSRNGIAVPVEIRIPVEFLLRRAV